MAFKNILLLFPQALKKIKRSHYKVRCAMTKAASLHPKSKRQIIQHNNSSKGGVDTMDPDDHTLEYTTNDS